MSPQLTKIDSDGVGRVVKCLSRLRMVGGTLHLAGVTGVVGTALKLTHVDRLVKIFPTAREASLSLSATPPPSSASPGH